MTSTPPRKKFSFHGLRLRFKSVDEPPLPGSTAAGGRPLTQRSATEPDASRASRLSRSVSFDKNRLPLRDSPPPNMPSPQTSNPDLPMSMPKAETEDVSQMPTPEVHAPDSGVQMPTPAVEMPTPETAAEKPPSVSMPVPLTVAPPTTIETQVLVAQIELPPVSYNATLSQNSEDQGNDPISGLADVAEKVHDGKPQVKKSRAAAADNALGTLEGKISTINGKVALVQQVVQPIMGVLEASGAVEIIKSGLNSFMEDIPWLMKSLDEVAKIHPFVTAAVLAFKAVYTMEMTRRNNDKRIISLFVSMKDMIAVLVQLRTIKDSHDIGPDGRTIEARMQSLSDKTAKDIKECANACDTYTKKRLLVKVLKGQIWEGKLVEWIGTFTKRKTEFEFALAMHTAKAVDSVKNTVEAMDQKLAALTATMLEMFKEWTPKNEQELARRVEEKGGTQAVRENDAVLRELYDFEIVSADGKKHTARNDAAKDQTYDMKSSTNPRQNQRATSSYSVHDLKDELREDWQTAVDNNMQVFQGKFALQQRQLQEELSKFIHEENNRVIDAVSRGPHDLIKHEELKAIWKEMGWRRNVKARLFVMTLRDNYSEVPTRTSTAVAAALGKDGGDAPHTDDWAFQYISVNYLQPIMEAFDDDGSGYITVSEVNRFVDTLPQSIKWSLPHWIAYWAIGWQHTATNYCKKIGVILSHMNVLKHSVLPENRDWAEYYLGKIWQVAVELIASPRAPEDPPAWLEGKFQEYVTYEEERIRKNLVDVNYDIDALDTVYIVAGPGRIEKYIYPLIYLLLKRDIEIFEVAKTQVLHKDELWDSADSLLWVYDAMWARYKDLRALFTQQKLDIDHQMKVYACEMFEYYNDNSLLFGMSNLETRSFMVSDEPVPVGQWDKSVKLLNYPIQEKYPINCEAYEMEPEQLNDQDLQARVPVKAILGQWNGFIYNGEEYPKSHMTSFFAHASSQEGQDFEATGLGFHAPFTLTGKCYQDCQGIISVTFVIRYSECSDTQYFSGHLLPDGSLVGTQGLDDNASEHPNHFILRQSPAEIMCHRPSPQELTSNKAHALWKYALGVVRAQVLRRMWSWTYFKERRDIRNRAYELNLRYHDYGRYLDDDEDNERTRARQAITIQDANFQRSIMEHKLRVLPSHLGFGCDGCSYEIGGIRTFCLTCQPKKGNYYRTVDFCDHPDCLGATIPIQQREDLERPHVPEHDFLRIRTVMQYRDQPDMDRRAKKALRTCREHFNQTGECPSEEGERGEQHEPAHAEVAQTGTESDTDVSGGEPSNADADADKTAEVSPVAADGSATVAADGSWTAGNTASEVEPKPNGDEFEIGEEGHADDQSVAGSHHDADDAAATASTSSTSTLRNTTCGVCHNHVEQPCWFCVDCNDRDIKFFICDDCESKTLLRCVNCEGLYKQPTWYYGHDAKDSYMCNKCQAKGVEPPEVDKDAQHTYCHALVRCKPACESAADLSSEERIAALEAKVDGMDEKMTRLEDYLVKVESALGLLLAKLGSGELRKP